jgi:hypothetical protein
MHPSRSTAAAAARRRTGLTGLLALSFTAGVAAVAADLSARDVRPLPVVLEFAALLAGAGAVRLAHLPAVADAGVGGGIGAEPQPARRQRPDVQGPDVQAASRTPRAASVQAPLRIPPQQQSQPPQPQQPPPAQPPRQQAVPRPVVPPTAAGMPTAGPASTAAPRQMPGSAADDPNASARRAFVNLARRIQGAVNRQLRELRELEARHGGDPEVFGDLLQVDHATALIGRLADSLAVLGGDRPARRWQRPIPLVSVLRGAMSRITDYRRVEIGPLPDRVGVDGGAVEALVHALAELLDNATRYSPPDTRVSLGARKVDGGIAIEVADAGVGLSPAAAKQADLVLRTRDFGLELASLGESPRLGLAVVGRLALTIGFEASLHPADGGGLCARIRVPAALLRELPQDDLAPVKPEQRPHSHRAAQPGRTPTEPPPSEMTAHGLPQRRRKAPDAQPAASQSTSTLANQGADAAAATETAAPAPGLWLTAFQAGLRGEAGDGASRGDGRVPE